jgi:hypothetical protein
VSVTAILWRLLSHYLASGVFTETFPSNGCLYWLDNSYFGQTCHGTPTTQPDAWDRKTWSWVPWGQEQTSTMLMKHSGDLPDRQQKEYNIVPHLTAREICFSTCVHVFHLIYLTALTEARTLQRSVLGCLLYDGLERKWKRSWPIRLEELKKTT